MDRTGSNLIADGARAGASTIERLFGVDIAKALDPLDPKGFMTIADRFAKELHAIAVPMEERAVHAALKNLDVDWASLNKAQRSAALRAANKSLAVLERRIPPAVETKFESQGEAVVQGTKRAIKRRFAKTISTSVTDSDIRTVEFMSSSHSNYVRDEYGRRRDQFSRVARAIVSDGLSQGFGRDDIAEDLAKKLSAQGINRTESYWQVVSNAFVNRARSFTTLSSFTDAGIDSYQFEAVMDEHTSEVCRMLHGRTFSVSRGLSRLQAIEDSGDPESIRSETPWVERQSLDDEGRSVLFFKRGDEKVEIGRVERSAVGSKDAVGEFSGVASNEELEAFGVTIPPIHALCRSTIVAI